MGMANWLCRLPYAVAGPRRGAATRHRYQIPVQSFFYETQIATWASAKLPPVFEEQQPNGNALMPALDDIRALRAQRERALPQSRPTADDTDDDESDDPSVIESGALSHEDEMLAMRGTAPFGSSTPAPARYQEQSAPEASGWTTKHMQALTPIWITHSDEDAEAFCVRFSPDDTLLAAGCGDGVVRVFHTEDGRLAYKLEACASGLPTTAVRFRPTSAASKTRNVLLVA